MTKESLIKTLKFEGITVSRVLAAIKFIDRKNFVLPELAAVAYGNYSLPIGFGQTISQPFTVAFMLQLLQVKAGDKVFEIGAGSGWQTALLAFLVGPKGKVFAVEKIPQLARMAQTNAEKYKFISQGVVRIIKGDGSKGLKRYAPFDKIIAAASAQVLPAVWKKQLKIGGRLVAPIQHSLVAIQRVSRKIYQTTQYPGFMFVPLVTGD